MKSSPNRADYKQRGVTLIEIMIAVLVLMIGLLGLMKVASVTVVSTTRGRRITQAGTKASARLEALQNVPTATLTCLAGGTAPSSCLASCTAAGGESMACQMALGLDAASLTDATNTSYSYAFLVNEIVAGKLYDILVVGSFIDDTRDPPKTVRAVYRTAVYR